MTMTFWATALDAAFEWAWRASHHAAVVAAVVLAVRHLAGRGLPPAWRCALWCIVALRLVMPAAPQARWSVFNFSVTPPFESERVTPHNPPANIPGAASVTVGYG